MRDESAFISENHEETCACWVNWKMEMYKNVCVSVAVNSKFQAFLFLVVVKSCIMGWIKLSNVYTYKLIFAVDVLEVR